MRARESVGSGVAHGWVRTAPGRVLAVGLVINGCQESRGASGQGRPTARPAEGSSGAPQRPAVPTPLPQVPVSRVAVPSGISLPVQPGKGFGPVRFGATIETIERLMGAPCDQRSQLPSLAPDGAREVCRYFHRAVEFRVGPAGAVGMQAYRRGRPCLDAPSRRYGVFNGRFVEGAALGMLPGAVQELLGSPLRVERLATPTAPGTVMLHHYAEFRLQYDRDLRGVERLGSVELFRAAPTSP